MNKKNIKETAEKIYNNYVLKGYKNISWKKCLLEAKSLLT